MKKITIVKFEVNDRGSNGTGNWRIEVRPDTAKLTNVIGPIVTSFGGKCNLDRVFLVR